MAARALARAAGGKIVYQRGERRVTIDDATFGRTEYEVEAGQVVRIEHTDRDFIFPAESLILDGKLAVPQKGDRIAIVEDDHVDKQIFEVLAPAGSQVFKTCDAYGVMIRVHTKRIQ
jgi:hypothetical protein